MQHDSHVARKTSEIRTTIQHDAHLWQYYWARRKHPSHRQAYLAECWLADYQK